LTNQPTRADELPLAGRSICLDAGHGGRRGGAVNVAYDLDEAEINLDVAYALKTLFEDDGAMVHMTRVGNETVYNHERRRFCNRTGADILVSVHTNNIDDPSWNGAAALYHKDKDLPLAKLVLASMLEALGSTAPAGYDFTNFGLMYRRWSRVLRSNMPAVLTEPLFMSNPAEAKQLKTRIHEGNPATDTAPNLDTRRGQIALAIHQGVLDYFDYLDSLPPTPTPTFTPTWTPTRTPTATPTATPTPTHPYVTYIPIASLTN
jgi:N-acetylmuramoyl-L-alanine amidase